ncbi:site-specific integrase [uncultured Desulfuromonas sp.]|uniref:site-specific integrase n=1 Tax=uncultured Desulfuromonas sp. TaxID=181013 RepID=UPI002AAB5ADE|nr:site-specific integrase [uncultured Desulfuromonas sp.]
MLNDKELSLLLETIKHKALKESWDCKESTGKSLMGIDDILTSDGLGNLTRNPELQALCSIGQALRAHHNKPTSNTIKELTNTIDTLIQIKREQLTLNRYALYSEFGLPDDVIDRANELGLSDQLSEPTTMQQVRRALTRQDIDVWLIERERINTGDSSYDRERRSRPQSNSPLFSEASSTYLQSKEQSKSAKTVDKIRLNQKRFQEILPDLPVDQYTYEQLLDFPEELRKHLPQCGDKTRYDILIALSSFFNFCVERTWLARNPCPQWAEPDEYSATARVRKGSKPAPWSNAELERLFKTSYWSKPLVRYKKPQNFWLPLLAIFTGARGNELAQLYVEDVCYDDKTEYWYLDINDRAPDKSTKNKPSIRQIPLHPTLIKLGFLQYVEWLKASDCTHVFETLKWDPKTGRYGGFSSSWQHHTSRNVEWDDPNNRRVFHGLRKSFAANLLAHEVHREWIAEILGHTAEFKQTKDYTGVNPNLIKYVSEVEYPFDVVSMVGTWETPATPASLMLSSPRKQTQKSA